MSRLHRNAKRFITTRRYPIYYLQITKCGCTFIKNLFYYLDNDQSHPAGPYIHDHAHDLISTDYNDAETIKEARHVFTVLRDPVDRFFSLYFDKIYGTGPQNFAALRRILEQTIGLNLARNIGTDQHIQNATALINWIDANLRDETPEPVNPHWKPQHERLAKINGFGAWQLTLDGLDWQLPWFLGQVVPDIEKHMAAVKIRNASSRKDHQAAIATPALVDRIHEVYAQDLQNYAYSKARWDKREKQLAVPSKAPDPNGLRVLSTHRYKINLRVIPKSGSTYLRNLFYRLDHGRNHPDPLAIDADGACFTLSKDPARLAKDLNLVVLRNPIDRFLSVYFDKVWGQGTTAFPWLSTALGKNRRFNRGRDIDSAAHHDNMMRFLGFLETRFDKQPLSELNPHWRPQTHHLDRMQETGFKPLLLEDLKRQLPLVAEKTVPLIQLEMAALPELNKSDPPFPYEEFHTPYILDRLNALYAADFALYTRVKTEWQGSDTPPNL